MTVSQQLNSIEASSNSYDDDITITDIPPGYFPGVTDVQAPTGGSTTRKITVTLMLLEQAPGGTSVVNSNLYTKTAAETSVKVTVVKDGNTLAENTTNY